MNIRPMNIRPVSREQYESLLQTALRRKEATVWFKNVHYLNVYTGQVHQGHLYVAGQRIAYCGEKEPLVGPETEIVETEPGQVLVPGYIEPHAHPFQWYNPLTWGEHVLLQGTTVSVNDNLYLLRCLSPQDAIQFIEQLDALNSHLWLWWARYDPPFTGLEKEEPSSATLKAASLEANSLEATSLGSTSSNASSSASSSAVQTAELEAWLRHPLVVQAGELISWPQLLRGNEQLLEQTHMIRYEYGKRIEGHLPGSSAETIQTLASSGVSADHEALTAEDVVQRLRAGMYATLRYSSIRPDLPQLWKELHNHPELNLARLMLTSDGSSPHFVDESGCDRLLQLVMDAGCSPELAYQLVTLNPATYFRLDQDLGGLAPGRLAHVNVLSDLHNPRPMHVMVDGKWVVRDGQHVSKLSALTKQSLTSYFPPLRSQLKLTVDMLQYDKHLPPKRTGIFMLNGVITKPYEYTGATSLQEKESYVALVDPHGEWIVATRVQGLFNHSVRALASTHSTTEGYLLVGSDEQDMVRALHEVLHMGGGIVVHTDEEDLKIPLPLQGGMSSEPMPELMRMNQSFAAVLRKNGFQHEDPVYSLLFLSAVHLPHIRLTKAGLVNVKELSVIEPARHL